MIKLLDIRYTFKGRRWKIPAPSLALVGVRFGKCCNHSINPVFACRDSVHSFYLT